MSTATGPVGLILNDIGLLPFMLAMFNPVATPTCI